jgi:DNA-binding MarR family transcriptional regulator
VNSVHNEEGTTHPGAALDRVFELSVLLADAMGSGLVERGLTRARATVLWELHRQGPVTQRELSEALGVTPRNVTGLLDGLEGTGLVARGSHPTDRRATLVTLTELGSDVVATLHAEQLECARYLFGDLPAAELATFVASLDRILGRLRGADFDRIRLAALQRLDHSHETGHGTPGRQ